MVLRVQVLALMLITCTCRAANYYVDSREGNDSNAGTAPSLAWQTLDRVNATTFQPGDRIFFCAGSQFVGQLAPKGSGGVIDGTSSPIVIDMYGQGPLPRIDGDGKVLDAVLLRNVEYWDVSNLEITNHVEATAPWRSGVHIVSDGAGVMHHLHISRLFVHDVNGDLRKSREGCGIYFESRGGNQSCFDDLIIEHCHVVKTDRNGICQRTGNRTRSTGIIIRNNLLEDIGGDGIKTWGANGPLIECNILRGGRMRAADAAAGIWPFDCDDAVIQYNQVSGMKGTNDGQAFDSDYRCRRAVFQYNFSHDNDGGFMLLCAPGNSYCDGTIVRYNISQNDGTNSSKIFHISGNVTHSRIYNNTIYVGPDRDLPLMSFTTWSRGYPDDTLFSNNLFYVEGEVRYAFGNSRNTAFVSNLFFGNQGELPADEFAVREKPMLAKPGGALDWSSLRAYAPAEEAKLPRGRVVADNGGLDIFGKQVAKDAAPAIGAIN